MKTLSYRKIVRRANLVAVIGIALLMGSWLVPSPVGRSVVGGVSDLFFAGAVAGWAYVAGARSVLDAISRACVERNR
jgi:hypothetical protein